jgi:hypothetical protein
MELGFIVSRNLRHVMPSFATDGPSSRAMISLTTALGRVVKYPSPESSLDLTS